MDIGPEEEEIVVEPLEEPLPAEEPEPDEAPAPTGGVEPLCGTESSHAAG
jgi:hypothetical protein